LPRTKSLPRRGEDITTTMIEIALAMGEVGTISPSPIVEIDMVIKYLL
jgi:hypothetical protein